MTRPFPTEPAPITDMASLNVKTLLKANKRLCAELAARDGGNPPSAWRQHHNSSGKAKVRWKDEDDAVAAAVALAFNAAAYRCDWCDGWHIGRTK